MKQILAMLLVLCGFAESSLAQHATFGRYRTMDSRVAKRNYTMYMLPLGNMTVTQHYREVNDPVEWDGKIVPHPWGAPVHTTITSTVRLTNSFGIADGVYFRLMDMGENGILALNTELNFMAYQGVIGDVQYSPHAKKGEVAAGMTFGLAISADLKWGADAKFDKSRRLMYGVGAGLAPTYTICSYVNMLGRTRVIPFIKAEVGFMVLQRALKLRATMQLGKVLDMKYSDSDWFTDGNMSNGDEIPNDYIDVHMRSTNNFNVGLVIHVFTGEWEDSWW